MNRLHAELQRLYGLPPASPPEAAANTAVEDAAVQAEASGAVPLLEGERTRALVLELARPADWPTLQRVWQGVQADLGLPAPAIAVAGADGFQLWWSVAQPIALDAAERVLQALRQRYLPDVDPRRLRLLPQAGLHARPVPAALQPDGPWSAFVAQDLAPMFSEECWLDLPPNREGQADLLSRLVSVPWDDLDAAVRRLSASDGAAANASAAGTGTGTATPESPGAPEERDAPAGLAKPHQGAAGDVAAVPAGQAHRLAARSDPRDPREFLQAVMNDDAVDLALRVDAAKALLTAPR